MALWQILSEPNTVHHKICLRRVSYRENLPERLQQIPGISKESFAIHFLNPEPQYWSVHSEDQLFGPPASMKINNPIRHQGWCTLQFLEPEEIPSTVCRACDTLVMSIGWRPLAQLLCLAQDTQRMKLVLNAHPV